MSHPRRLLYPRTLIDRNTTKLRVQLRRLRRDIEKGQVPKEVGRAEGRRLLENHYRISLTALNEWLRKKGVDAEATGNEEQLTEALTEAVEGWNRIVDDLS